MKNKVYCMNSFSFTFTLLYFTPSFNFIKHICLSTAEIFRYFFGLWDTRQDEVGDMHGPWVPRSFEHFLFIFP